MPSPVLTPEVHIGLAEDGSVLVLVTGFASSCARVALPPEAAEQLSRDLKALARASRLMREGMSHREALTLVFGEGATVSAKEVIRA